MFEPTTALSLATKAEPQRRNSAGDLIANHAPGMIPFELLKQPIRPIGAPLAAGRFDYHVEVSTGDELIANKMDAIEEKRDPQHQWAHVNKYTTHAA